MEAVMPSKTYRCTRAPNHEIGPLVKFRNGLFETADLRAQDAIETSSWYGLHITKIAEEAPPAPVGPAPFSNKELASAAELSKRKKDDLMAIATAMGVEIPESGDGFDGVTKVVLAEAILAAASAEA
jgi:hypothetical protein